MILIVIFIYLYIYIYPFGATLLTLMETHDTDSSLQEDFGSNHRDLLLCSEG